MNDSVKELCSPVFPVHVSRDASRQSHGFTCSGDLLG